MITGTVVFITTSFLLYPISYIALLYQNFIDIWEKGNNGSSKWIEASQFFAMIVKAPFILLGGIFLDSSKFIRSLYSTRIKLHNEKAAAKKTDFTKMNCQYFKLVKKILFKKKGKLVDAKKIIEELNEEFGIHDHLRNIIYKSHSADATQPGGDECMSDSDSDIEGKMNH